ncbi:glycerol-3-phosphate cytidylyltransferase [Salinicola sp. 4072]|uniref:glycerol-3-phosphate cytidylyltransferase n=1 Tax=Salinicola sp. 4072 TaxID=3082157 RepID=UPI002FC84CB9
MKTVITYGTFDLLHVGHIRLLKRARSLGDKLIVGLSTDAFNAKKGKNAIFSYDARREILLALRLVDDVFAEENWEQKRRDIRQHNAQILAMGDDWAGKFDELSDITEVVYLPRTEAVSTTEIKTVISKITEEKLQTLDRAIEHIAKISKELR